MQQEGMQTSFFVATVRLPELQEAVKKSDMRFLGNPVVVKERAMVCLAGTVEQYHALCGIFRWETVDEFNRQQG